MEVIINEFKHCNMVSVTRRVDNATALQFTQTLDAQMDKRVFNLVVGNFLKFMEKV